MKRFTLFPLALLLTATLVMTGCGKRATAPGSDKVTQLQITDTKVGTGAEAKQYQMVTVHYTGWLYDDTRPDHHGKKFDSSHDRGQPFQFRLGIGHVIQGWDQGIAGMKVGGKRTLVIPASLGYGARGAGSDIPPHAALVFDVELLNVR
jgi:FKBP-type peptidyl-prolyl cis-trans isomerase FkpA